MIEKAHAMSEGQLFATVTGGPAASAAQGAAAAEAGVHQHYESG